MELFFRQRPTEVTVRAQDITGETFQIRLKGFQARIFQHEYDHLQGVLFHDRMKPRIFEKVRSKLVELEEEYCKENNIEYDALPESNKSKS